MAVLRSIGYNLANLANFSGRQTRAQFWPYAVLVVIALWPVAVVAIKSEIVDSMVRMQAFLAANPAMGTIEQGAGHVNVRVHGHHPELMPNMATLGIKLGLVVVGFVVLLGAAVVRRLHDTGKSGLWGLLPLPFLAFGFTMMPKLFAGGAGDTSLFFPMFLNNTVYIATLGTLAVLLARGSTANENRFGPNPAP